MTIEEARALWTPLLEGAEGFLDAAVRIQTARALTPTEAEALEMIWREFAAAMGRIADLFRAARRRVVAGAE